MTKTIHHGRNVKRFREMLQIKQDGLAYMLGEDWTQKRISALEQKDIIDDALLEEVAKQLKVPAEAIKNFDEEQAINIITHSTFENCQQPAVINYNPSFNPFDKYIEQVEKNEVLYEQLLKSERQRNELLQRMLDKK